MKRNLRTRKILQAANFFCRAAGLKAVSISHLPEKLAGERSFTLADLDAIQAIIPDDQHLRAYWFSAICSVSVAPVLAPVPSEDGASNATVLPAPHPPLFPSPAAAKREAA